MQRVRILSSVQVGRQWLSAGVDVLLPSDDARALIASGHAQAVDAPGGDAHPAQAASPVLDGMIDVPAAPPRRRKAGG